MERAFLKPESILKSPPFSKNILKRKIIIKKLIFEN
jgi:hypothetical protein